MAPPAWTMSLIKLVLKPRAIFEKWLAAKSQWTNASYRCTNFGKVNEKLNLLSQRPIAALFQVCRNKKKLGPRSVSIPSRLNKPTGDHSMR